MVPGVQVSRVFGECELKLCQYVFCSAIYVGCHVQKTRQNDKQEERTAEGRAQALGTTTAAADTEGGQGGKEKQSKQNTHDRNGTAAPLRALPTFLETVPSLVRFVTTVA